MDFCYIVPKKAKVITANRSLLLAHLMVKDNSYLHDVKTNRSKFGYLILDNGAFENGSSIDIVKLAEIADEIMADEIVLPDVFMDPKATIESTVEAIEVLKERYPEGIPFKLMAVPQGKDLTEYLQSYTDISSIPEVDVIAVNRASSKLLGSRMSLVRHLNEEQWRAVDNGKPLHLLGMADNILEILVASRQERVRSMDSCFPYLIAREARAHELYSPDGICRDSFATSIDFDAEWNPEIDARMLKIVDIIENHYLQGMLPVM